MQAQLLSPKLNTFQILPSSIPPYWSVRRDYTSKHALKHSIFAYLSPSTIGAQFNHLGISPTRQECSSLSLALFFHVCSLNHAGDIQTVNIAHANCAKLSCSLLNSQLHSNGRIFSTPFSQDMSHAQWLPSPWHNGFPNKGKHYPIRYLHSNRH